MDDPKQKAAAAYELAAEKLDRAAAHCRIAALHYGNGEVPRGCAHAFAALGDLRQGEELIDANAVLHAGKASIDLDPGAAS